MSPSNIVKLQLAIPTTATLLRRYAEETEDPVKEMFQVHSNITCKNGTLVGFSFYKTKCTFLTYCIVLLMLKGQKWIKDQHFQSPTHDVNGSRYFLGEIVNFRVNGSTNTGKLMRFFTKVLKNAK